MARKPSMPIRVDAALLGSARAAGAGKHRSAAQQLAYWARLGREVEATLGLSAPDVDRALAGELSYDDLDNFAQAVLRASWHESIGVELASLDLRSRFRQQGHTHWCEADADGVVSVHRFDELNDSSDGLSRPE